ncbi:hypothetical protein [Pseudoxanthomonas japonensis]|uniref:Secreted protein n=1 Tax=Pseudoxanthomonas japonensis TaxID=69284 RepID=A0ABQ6ZJ30_9GAMM|nr:hypothetical protein [Pseudoxanthomonas japonensis]KAF1726126.1 hypothetical protein CSC78_05460 [Pseudoxanthomonas japonensis]
MRKLVLVSIMLLVIPVAHGAMSAAAGSSADKPQRLNVSVPFEQQREQILTQMGDGETYSEISQQDRQDVRDALNRIGDSLLRTGGVDQLSASDKVKVFNDQELVNTILTRAHEDSRQVCTREKKVGSHRATTQCYTVAERRRMREDSQNEMSKTFRQPILESR